MSRTDQKTESWPPLGGRLAGGGAVSEPLGTEEEEALRVVARRLRAELRSVLSELSLGSAGPSEVSRHLKLDRATVHRTIALARSSGDELEWLLGAPGVDGLGKFVRAARRVGASEGRVASLEAAVDRLADLISTVARSKASLDRRIEATRLSSRAAPVSDEPARAAMVQHASELIGRHTAARVDLVLFRRSPDREGWIDQVWVRGCIGHRARGSAQPLVVGFMGHAEWGGGEPGEAETLDDDRAWGRTPSAVLGSFSSSPPPLVTSRTEQGNLLQLIDPARTKGGESVDVVVAHHRPHACIDPAREDVPRLEVNALVRDPASALVFDVYLERDFVRGALPELDLYVWSPTMERSMSEHWYDRLPMAPRLELLGQGTRRSPSGLYERMGELTAHVFDRAGWRSESFVGFRCATRYPLWGGAYCLSFDLGESGAGGGEG